MFPLCEDEDAALRCDEEEQEERHWEKRVKSEPTSSTDENSVSVQSHPFSALSSTTAPPDVEDGNNSLTAESPEMAWINHCTAQVACTVTYRSVYFVLLNACINQSIDVGWYVIKQ